MNSIMSKNQFFEKRWKDKQKKDEEDVELSIKNPGKRNKKIKKITEDYKKYYHQLQETNKTRKLRKKSNMN